MKNVGTNTEDIVEKDEMKLLKEQLKMLEEKNAHLKISLENQKQKNHDLQREIKLVRTTADKKVNMLEDDLLSKIDEVNLLKEQLDIQTKDHQACKKELYETKNQLYYKHLALDGIIKSNIKLQEQLASCVTTTTSQQNANKNSACKTAVSRRLQTDVDDVIKSNDVSHEMKRKSSAAKQTGVSRPRTGIDASVELMLPYKDAERVEELKVIVIDSCKAQSISVNENQKKRRRRNKKRFD